jgi:hypothetical protein
LFGSTAKGSTQKLTKKKLAPSTGGSEVPAIVAGQGIKQGFRKYHQRNCVSEDLRRTLPLRDTDVDIPSRLNIRSGPSTSKEITGVFEESGIYTIDLISASGCWIRIGYPTTGDAYAYGWVSSKHLEFGYN